MKMYKVLSHYPFQRGILNTVLIAALFLVVTLSPLAHSHGQGTEKSAEVLAVIAEQKNRAKELNQQLESLISDYKSAKATESSGLVNQLSTLAEERQQILFDLMENDPESVLKLTLPDLLQADLPDSVRGLFEHTEEVEGELVVQHEDHVDPNQSRFNYYLVTHSGERFSLHFAANPPGLVSGTSVRAHGAALNRSGTHAASETDSAMVVESGDTGILTLEKGSGGGSGGSSSVSMPSTLGEQRTLVILVNFQDAPVEPYTATFAQSMIFGTTSDFFLQNSYQQTWLSGNVLGWLTIAASSTVCDTATIATQAKSAATAAGVDLTAYSHYVYAFPQNACGFWGLSSVGGSPSESWLNGELKLGVTAHELGHGLGLFHSHALDCNVTTLGSSCATYEYGNMMDMMGASSFAHYNAFQKERLGWLNTGSSPQITTILASGAYTLEPIGSDSSGPKALKILKSTDPSTGKRTWYYVESRQAAGFDAGFAGNSNVINGVLIHLGTESNANSSDLLDMTPASGSTLYWDWNDPALEVGQSFEDIDAGMIITTDSVSASQTTVTVNLTGMPIKVAVSTDRSSYSLTQTVSMTATVSEGGAPVANSSVTFTITKTNGAIVTGTATTGSNGNATYKLRLSTKDPVGIYQAAAIATSNALSGNDATTFTVK